MMQIKNLINRTIFLNNIVISIFRALEIGIWELRKCNNRFVTLINYLFIGNGISEIQWKIFSLIIKNIMDVANIFDIN